MLCTKRILKLGALLWVGGVALTALALARDAPSARMLTALEMRDTVKGATPVDCTHSLIILPCDDPTGCAFKGPADCLGPCIGCSNLLGNDEYCNRKKPWTVLRCQQINITGQCGVYFDNPQCVFIAPGACECRGPLGPIPCSRYKARFFQPCVIVPPP